MVRYSQKNFRNVSLRIRILLLVINRPKISEVLMLKVGCLRVSEKEFFINIGHQNLFIRNSLLSQLLVLGKKILSIFIQSKMIKT